MELGGALKEICAETRSRMGDAIEAQRTKWEERRRECFIKDRSAYTSCEKREVEVRAQLPKCKVLDRGFNVEA